MKQYVQYEFLEDSEPYGDHADLLVARDNDWRRVLLYEEYWKDFNYKFMVRTTTTARYVALLFILAVCIISLCL